MAGMNRTKHLIKALLLAICVILSGWPGPLALAEARDPSPPSNLAPVYGLSETGLYILRLTEPSVASYTGGLRGLPATSPRATGAARLDAQAPATRAYTEYLQARHADVERAMASALGRPVETVYHYYAALNGLAVRVSHQEALRLAALPGVAAIYADTLQELDTDVSPTHIGAPAIWGGDTTSGLATRGEGVIIGIIDSGINSQHPSFRAIDGDGYAHVNPYGSAVYHGWCASHAGFCNNKLIGAYTFHPNGGSPEDTDGHGSHTASTAAGNVHTATIGLGGHLLDLPISGVAPRANIVAYKVCDPSCPGSSSIAAVESAIAVDEVDVLNFSISGADAPWLDPVSLAFLEAYNAGIFVSTSAGNTGPTPGTVGKTAPWNASVAASTTNRVLGYTLDVTGPTTPAALQGLAAVPGEGTWVEPDLEAALRFDPANASGCTAFGPDYFLGALALIQRGGCDFSVKVSNAALAGALGVVMINSMPGPPFAMTGLTGTPSAVMVAMDDGVALREYVLANPTATARIHAALSATVDDDWADLIGSFSSRGPSQYEVLKPDYAAPGVSILAAAASAPGDPERYVVLQGTSMASPHGAGAAALLMALHPTWSPAQVKSALAITARTDLLIEDGVTPAGPFDMGSGVLDLAAAAHVGVVLDETGANYAAANPATGGDPSTLNQPNLVDYACSGTCTFTRTVESVLDTAVTYQVQTSAAPGMVLTSDPITFTIPAGGSQAIEITADISGLGATEPAFGDVALVPEVAPAGAVPASSGPVALHLPVVVIPFTGPPVIGVDPDQVSASLRIGESMTETLSISNSGESSLEWEITENPTSVSLLRLAAAQTAPAPEHTARVRTTIGDNVFAHAAGSLPVLAATPEGAAPAMVAASGAVSITHSVSQDVAAGVSIACSGDGGETTLANQYLRTFNLADFGILGDWYVTDVSFGIENLSGLVNRTVTVNLYTLEGDLTYANLTLIATEDAVLSPQVLSMATVPIEATVPEGAVLVVEVAAPDLGGQAAFFAGANSAGQTAPSYIAAAGCGIADPVSMADIGHPETHLVMSVTGEGEAPECDLPGGVTWATAEPLFGAVAPGDSAPVTVTLEATGVAVGEHHANMCIQSNDPAQPLVIVPLTLEVAGAPEIQVSPASLEAGLMQGQQQDLPLSIENIGVSDLHWNLDTAPAAAPTGATYASPNGSPAAQTAPDEVQAAALGSLAEGFTDITTLAGAGWTMINNSAPLGVAGWFQGNSGVFPAQAGAQTSYIAANYNSTLGSGTISTWLLTPEVLLGNGNVLTFYTRVPTGSPFPDRLQVRLSTNGASTDVGSTSSSVGDFDTLLLDVNPTLSVGGYPETWTRYDIVLSGLPGPVTGRLAFRYFVPDGGPSGTNSNYIGIDSVTYTALGGPCASPGAIPWLSVLPTSGSTAPGATDMVTVTLDSTGVEGGVHTANLCVLSDAANQSVVAVPVTMVVTDTIPTYLPISRRR